jgi:hypothetical protein
LRYTGTSSLAVEMATESFGLCRVTHQCSNQRSACGLKTCSSTRGSVVDIAERNAMDQAPDLKQRFEREAKTISSLNHPHICTTSAGYCQLGPLAPIWAAISCVSTESEPHISWWLSVLPAQVDCSGPSPPYLGGVIITCAPAVPGNMIQGPPSDCAVDRPVDSAVANGV